MERHSQLVFLFYKWNILDYTTIHCVLSPLGLKSPHQPWEISRCLWVEILILENLKQNKKISFKFAGKLYKIDVFVENNASYFSCCYGFLFFSFLSFTLPLSSWETELGLHHAFLADVQDQSYSLTCCSTGSIWCGQEDDRSEEKGKCWIGDGMGWGVTSM